ncbi:MAG: DUF5668 domain-containing protein [Tissierellaceae bacterium]|nr:DUF5668 domain-containing protein [Tissierellaceae bacterium]
MKNKGSVGLILIVIGVILLLFNLGYINFNVFLSLFNLWPLLLVAVGISIIFKNNQVVSYITWGLFFVIIIAFGIYTQDVSNTLISSNDNILIDKSPETKYADLHLDIGASNININSTDDYLILVDPLGKPLDYKEQYKNNKENAVISFESKMFNISRIQRHNEVSSFYLNKDVIWDLEFDLGAISGKINLEDIPVRKIDLDSGAADLTFILGNKHDLDFEIDTGVSNVNIIMPQDVGLKIEIDSALSSSNIKDMNLIARGDYYISRNYDEANVVINMNIDMGLGNIDFSYR